MYHETLMLLIARCTCSPNVSWDTDVINSEMHLRPQCYRETLAFLIARCTCSPNVSCDTGVLNSEMHLQPQCIVRHWCY